MDIAKIVKYVLENFDFNQVVILGFILIILGLIYLMIKVIEKIEK